MRQAYRITTPFVKPEESARILGLPARRAKELIRMVRESLARKGYRLVNGKNGSSNTNAAEEGAARSEKSKMNPRAKKAKSPNASRKKLARGKAKNSN